MMASTEPVNEVDKALTLETPLMTHWGTLTADRVIEYLLKKLISGPAALPLEHMDESHG